MASRYHANHSASALRLMSDLKECTQSPPEGCSASPASDDSLYDWHATIIGPQDTPFEGGIFQLRLQFSERYPAVPPRVRFARPDTVFHPNIYADGHICLDALQDRWSPVQSVASVLVSILSLLSDPNPASPANPGAAELYVRDRAAYDRRVRRCAQRSLEEC